MKFLDFFSGIGGFRSGLESVGFEPYGWVEFDKFARQSYEAIYDTEDEWTRWDITEVTDGEWKELENEVDIITGGFPCFVEGTLITTSEGYKNIEDVKRGDKVLTHTNTFNNVVVPMKKHKKGIFNVKIQGSPSNKVTEEHPYYVREMRIVYSKEKRNKVRTWSDPKWVEAKDLKPGVHFVGFSENIESVNRYDLTEEEAWLIGRYIADGYIQDSKRSGRENSYNRKVIFTVGKAKEEEFEQVLQEYHATKYEDETNTRYIITSKRLMGLVDLCGRGAENKELPGYILSLPKRLLELVIEGYLSGDGSVRDGKYSATTVSKKLVYSLGQAVQKVYNTPYSILYTERPDKHVIEGRIVNQRDTYRIQFRKETRKQNNSVYIDGMLWNPVRDVTYDSEWVGYVYNFEVEEDNSYVANNATVHNCQAFSYSGLRKGFEDTRGTLFFEIARAAKHIKPKYLLLENVKGLVSHDKGKTLDTIVKVLNDTGYIVDFEILNSKYHGVPQNRERIFIIGVREDLIDPEEWVIVGDDVVAKGKKRISKYEGIKTFNFNYPNNDKVTSKLRDVLETDVEDKYYLSKEQTDKLTLHLENRVKKEDEIKVLAHRKGYRRNMQTFDKDGLTETLDTGGGGGRGHYVMEYPDNVMIGASRGRNPSNPSDRTTGAPTEQRLEINEKGTTNTLTSVQKDNYVVEIGGDITIRKLTPKETWRLQGFTDEQLNKAKKDGLSDTQLYKQAGNAVTVSVVSEIAKKLKEFDKINKK